MTEFPNKCIKCKKVDIPLKKFVFARSIMSPRFKTVYINVPVCPNCKKELMKYERLLKFLKLKYCFFCVFCSSTFLSVAWSMFNPRISLIIISYAIIISGISGLLTAILLVSHLILNYKNPDRISNYIEIKMDGSIIIKDPEYRKEYEELASSTEDELFNCPSCNTLLMKDMEFCHVCGLDLKKIR